MAAVHKQDDDEDKCQMATDRVPSYKTTDSKAA